MFEVEKEKTGRTLYVSFFALINPEKIWFLKFILEGHDGLALLSTLKREQGVVRLTVHRSRYTELVQLLKALSPAIRPAGSA